MARYEHLPIYKSVYDLNLYFFKLSRGFPKDFKYTLAEDIKNLLSELLDQIIIANNVADKQENLGNAEIIVERIKIKNRLLHDLKVTKLSSYKYFAENLIEISKQIEKWLVWAKKEKSQS
jgi:hypothetical protein